MRKPDNVLDFLIKQLEGNQNSTLKVIAEKLILVIYPPGLAISEPVRNYFVGCEVVHCGKILLKSSEGFGEQAKEHLK